MPNYKGHLVGGMVGFALVVFLCSLHVAPCMTLVEWLLCVCAGSLFPDIDTKSKGQKLFYLLLTVALLVFIVRRQFKIVAGIALVCMLPLLSKHRGIFHHFWFILAIVFIAVLYLVTWYPAAATRIIYDAAFFILGVMSHLYLDVGIKRMLRIS